jgi:hypothetical protein
MCGKMGVSEVDTIKNMMTMTVYFVLADIFDLDIMDIESSFDLEKDLHITSDLKALLSEAVMDMFNGLELNFTTIHNVQDIVEQIVIVEPINSIH